MDDTENAREVAGRYRAAWLANDLAGIVECYAEDFSLYYFGSNPWSGSSTSSTVAVRRAPGGDRRGVVVAGR